VVWYAVVAGRGSQFAIVYLPSYLVVVDHLLDARNGFRGIDIVEIDHGWLRGGYAVRGLHDYQHRVRGSCRQMRARSKRRSSR
jgi:hypothetical protein